MHDGMKKTLSVLIVIFTSLGFLLSVFFLVQIWRYRQPVSDKVQNQVDQFSGVLHTTDDALVVIDKLVKNVYTSTIFLEETTTALSTTLTDTNQFIYSASTFIGDNLITTITNTQAALDSAQASAMVIDNILTGLSRIPLIGVNYNPEVPLNVALGDVSTSLDPLPEILTSFQTDLETTYSNLELFTGQISSLDKNINSITNNMQQAQVTIADYHTQLTSLISWTDRAKTNVRIWVNTITWILTAIILWLFVIQISILLQNMGYLTPIHKKQEQESVLHQPEPDKAE